MDIVHPSSVRLSDYTSLFCAKGLLIGSALRFVLLLTTDTVVGRDTRGSKSGWKSIMSYPRKDERDRLMLITIGNTKETRCIT